MPFDSHTLRRAENAATLVNALVPGLRGGKPFPAPRDEAELLERIAPVFAWAKGRPAAEHARGLQRAAGQLYTVFAAAAESDYDAAADQLNALMIEYDARPTLIRYPGEPWTLHYHAADATAVPGFVSGMAASLAILFGDGQAERIGICSADACDRAFVDVSRNGTKRFCSTACQNRAKTAAFRARQNSDR